MSDAIEQARGWLMKPPTYEELLQAQWEILEDEAALIPIRRLVKLRKKFK